MYCYLTLLLKYFLLCLLETGEHGEFLTLSITNVRRGDGDCQGNDSVQKTMHKPNVGAFSTLHLPTNLP